MTCQVGVAAAFAVAVHAALDVRRAPLHGGQRARDRRPRIVVRVDASTPSKRCRTSEKISARRWGEPAVGVAKAENIRARGFGGLQGAQSEGGVADVAVEECSASKMTSLPCSLR